LISDNTLPSPQVSVLSLGGGHEAARPTTASRRGRSAAL
jgi:hypothetical protein